MTDNSPCTIWVSMMAKVNDAIGEWRWLVSAPGGDEHPKSLEWIVESGSNSLDLMIRRGQASPDSRLIGLCEKNGRPMVVVCGNVEGLDSIGPAHGWAHELRNGSFTNRKNGYILCYEFPEGLPTQIPSKAKFLDWAKHDALAMISQAYDGQNGNFTNPNFTRSKPVTAPVRDYVPSNGPHEAEWGKQLKALERGRGFTPFIDINGTISHYEDKQLLGNVKSAEAAAAKLSNRLEGAASQADLPFLRSRMTFLRGSTVALGGALMVVGVATIIARSRRNSEMPSDGFGTTVLRKSPFSHRSTESYLTKPQRSLTGLSDSFSVQSSPTETNPHSLSTGTDQTRGVRGSGNTPHSYGGWEKLEIGAGAGLMLLGALAGRGRGR